MLFILAGNFLFCKNFLWKDSYSKPILLNKAILGKVIIQKIKKASFHDKTKLFPPNTDLWKVFFDDGPVNQELNLKQEIRGGYVEKIILGGF
ncbi:hypothetical protein [Bacillus sp. FJAT-27245]|uniref:hypothetical protein n=1 Tax=Bacillus sp. FJAT-27245 TaxID=1684144 RepID=UPI0006A7C984|nr:hypothetical protein [Bacillus sp. FJAT-27245]